MYNYEGDTIITGSKDNTCKIWRDSEVYNKKKWFNQLNLIDQVCDQSDNVLILFHVFFSKGTVKFNFHYDVLNI